jgi:hypothetical protein
LSYGRDFLFRYKPYDITISLMRKTGCGNIDFFTVNFYNTLRHCLRQT